MTQRRLPGHELPFSSVHRRRNQPRPPLSHERHDCPQRRLFRTLLRSSWVPKVSSGGAVSRSLPSWRRRDVGAGRINKSSGSCLRPPAANSFRGRQPERRVNTARLARGNSFELECLGLPDAEDVDDSLEACLARSCFFPLACGVVGSHEVGILKAKGRFQKTFRWLEKKHARAPHAIIYSVYANSSSLE